MHLDNNLRNAPYEVLTNVCCLLCFSLSSEPGHSGQYDTVPSSPLGLSRFLPSAECSPHFSPTVHFIRVCFILTGQACDPWALIVQEDCRRASLGHWGDWNRTSLTFLLTKFTFEHLLWNFSLENIQDGTRGVGGFRMKYMSWNKMEIYLWGFEK